MQFLPFKTTYLLHTRIDEKWKSKSRFRAQLLLIEFNSPFLALMQISRPAWEKRGNASRIRKSRETAKPFTEFPCPYQL